MTIPRRRIWCRCSNGTAITQVPLQYNSIRICVLHFVLEQAQHTMQQLLMPQLQPCSTMQAEFRRQQQSLCDNPCRLLLTEMALTHTAHNSSRIGLFVGNMHYPPQLVTQGACARMLGMVTDAAVQVCFAYKPRSSAETMITCCILSTP